MITIGVQTKGILLENGIEKGTQMIRDAGFDCVDLNLDVFLKNSDVYAGKINDFFKEPLDNLGVYFGEWRKQLDAKGLKASQMHAPYPYYIDGKGGQNDFMMQEVIPKSIIIAEILGVPWMVLHPAKLQYIYDIETEKQFNISYFRQLIPLLKQCHVGLCVENLYEGDNNRIIAGTCADPEEACWYVDTLNEEAGEELFGVCLDVGHLQLVRRDPYDYIKTLGSRLKILHLHENDAVGDEHQMPFSFGSSEEQGLNWKRIAQALKEIGFDGTLSFETFPCMNSFPMGMEQTVLEVIHSIGVCLRNEIEG